MKKRTKGFTLTELIVVIVIIGILAAVLIPVLTSYINKARVSNDNVLVRNLNNALSLDSADRGVHKNMSQALDAAKEYGYDVGKINASKTDNEILWDSKNDVFCYLDNGQIKYIPEAPKKITSISDEDYWVIRDVKVASDIDTKYSTYIRECSLDTSSPLNISLGIDVGENSNIDITYENLTSEKTLIIVTNGGTLTINAPHGTVKHYGIADKVDVVAIYSASYHENGTVSVIAVKSGHVQLEGEADVDNIYVYNNSNGTDVDTSFEAIKITVDFGVEVPDLSRSAVEIGDDGTKICTVVTDQAKDIYLFNEGIYEQVKTVDAGKPITDSSAKWADNNANSESTQTAAQQLANEFNGSRDANDKIQNREVEYEAVNYTVVFDYENRVFETYKGYENNDNKGTQIVVTNEQSEVEQAEKQAILDGVSAAANIVTESGKTMKQVIASVYVKAEVTPLDLSEQSPITLEKYKNFTNSVYLDSASEFSGFNDEDFELLVKFITALDEHGDAIFDIEHIDIDSVTDKDNFNKALAYVEKEYGISTKNEIIRIFNQKEDYFDWIADFEISFDGDIEEGSIAFGGHYGAFADGYNEGLWIGFGLPQTNANTSFRLLQTIEEFYPGGDWEWPYIAILAIVQRFSCGAANLSNENIGKTLYIDLCIYKYENDKVVDRIVCGHYFYTFGEVSKANENLINQWALVANNE